MLNLVEFGYNTPLYEKWQIKREIIQTTGGKKLKRLLPPSQRRVSQEVKSHSSPLQYFVFRSRLVNQVSTAKQTCTNFSI